MLPDFGIWPMIGSQEAVQLNRHFLDSPIMLLSSSILRACSGAGLLALLIGGLSGCVYTDPVTPGLGTNYQLFLYRPPAVSKILPGRTLYIRTERSYGDLALHDDQYLVNAFAATQLFADIKVTEDPYPPSDSYLLQRVCGTSSDEPDVAALAWIVTVFISPAYIRHHSINCTTSFRYVDPSNSWSPSTLYEVEQSYDISEYANGFSVIPLLMRGSEAEAYNPVAIANDTVNHVMWGLK